MRRLLIAVALAAICALVLPVNAINAYSGGYSCESGKEDGCFGDAEFAFIERNLPYQIGKYDTNGGYPDHLASAPQYYLQDVCGMENRTSESYAILNYQPQSGGFAYCPFLDITADKWAEYAQARENEGYILSDTPLVGSIAIMNIGHHGHAAVVREILDNGKIKVAQYDLVPGSYSESIIKPHGIKFLIQSPVGGKSS